MPRTTRTEYLTTADYSLGWGDNHDLLSKGIGGTKDDAMRHARGFSDQMRRHGAASAIRLVRVRHWRDALADAPVLFHASYYDIEQGLTEAEVYAARVHDWHAMADRNNKVADLGPMPYHRWSEDWGPEPASCPACGVALKPQNYYKYNGNRFVRLDGTSQVLGT